MFCSNNFRECLNIEKAISDVLLSHLFSHSVFFYCIVIKFFDHVIIKKIIKRDQRFIDLLQKALCDKETGFFFLIKHN